MSEFVLSGQELFGRYARIAYGHALGGEQDYHIYKCIQSFRSNCYCDVPLTYQTENNCYNHENIVDVVNVIHCGIDENRVIRVALNDIELLPVEEVDPVKCGFEKPSRADSIRSMTDEELADLLRMFCHGMADCKDCPLYNVGCPMSGALHDWIKWLQQPAEVDHEDKA